MRDISPAIFIGDLDELQRDHRKTTARSRIGAGVTYTEAFAPLAQRIPALGELIDRIGGEQVRNMGTIGGNIANGSPIGDMPPPLIALGATLTLRRGDERRDDAAGGFLHRLWQAGPAAGRVRRERASCRCPRQATRFAGYKITKRFDQDISAVLGAFHLTLATTARWQTPHRLWRHGGDAEAGAQRSRRRLLGKPWTEATVEAALRGLRRGFHAADRHARVAPTTGCRRRRTCCGGSSLETHRRRTAPDSQRCRGMRRRR